MYAIEEFEDKIPDFEREARKAFRISEENPEQMTTLSPKAAGYTYTPDDDESSA